MMCEDVKCVNEIPTLVDIVLRQKEQLCKANEISRNILRILKGSLAECNDDLMSDNSVIDTLNINNKSLVDLLNTLDEIAMIVGRG